MPSSSSRAIGRNPATLPELARAAATTFPIGAVLILAGALPLLLTSVRANVAAAIALLLLVLVGIALAGAGVVMYVHAARWNRLRQGAWRLAEVTVVPEDADWERRRTLLDTNDGRWRIAIVGYPLQLRDLLVGDGRLEYVGDLAGGRILVRRPGLAAEHFAGVRLRSSLCHD